MSAQKLVSKFRNLGLPIDGLVLLRNNILTVGDRSIDVHGCNFGYLRTSGIRRYKVGQQITGCDTLNEVTEDLYLVLILAEDKNLDAYVKAARQILDADKNVQLLQIDVNKEAIQRAEGIPPSLNKIAKITFEYNYEEVGACPEGLCEIVADVQCDVEPCESKSFCERVQECLPDCTLQVGDGCCDYLVEGILLPSSNCGILQWSDFTYTDDEGSGINSIILEVSGFDENSNQINVTLLNVVLDAEQFSVDELCQYIIDNYDGGGYFTITRGSDYIEICSTLNNWVLSGSILGSNIIENNVSNLNLIGFGDVGFQTVNFSDGYDFFSYEIDATPLTFQVLINSTWTDVTDEIVDGTWQRTNVCDDVITEWRIIDSEENIVASGEVTAICDDAIEITESVCYWLQAHQTAIEQLQQVDALTCETLAECEVIVDIQDSIALKANTADLGAVAFTNDYNDLDNLPSIPDVSGYVPYTGATQDVDLGVQKITADAIAFDLSPVNSPGSGQIAYVGNTGALAYNMNASQVTSQIGQTMHALVHNAEGVQILKGQAVYIFGASGNKASVKLAFNTSDATSARTFGLAAENIGAGQNGFVITQGVLDGLNTGAYNAGDILYLGATAGTLTSVKPYAPNHMVYIGVVERANNGNGQIYVKVQNGYELDEIHDVDLITTPPVNNDLLTYKTGASNLWKPQSLGTLLGGNTGQYVRGNGTLATFPNCVQVVGIDATANALTGNVTNGIVATVLIPANTMTTNTIVEFEAFIRKVSATAVANMRVHINNANNMTGAQQLAFLQGASNNVTLKMERSFIVTSTGLTIFPQGVTANIDDQQSTTAVTNLTVDWTVNQWLHLTANNAAGETTTNIFLFVKKSAP